MRIKILFFIIMIMFSFLPANAKQDAFDWGIAWINSPKAYGIESDRGYELARATGVTLEHRQYLWGDVELSEGQYNWFELDHWIISLTTRKMKVSISIGPINTLDFKIPSDLEGKALDSSEVVARYVSFLQTLVDRYKITYLAFSNEPNLYYREFNQFLKGKNSPSSVEEFFRFTQATYDKIRELPEFDNIQVVGIFALTLIYEGTIIEDDFSIEFTNYSTGYDVFGISTYDGILNRPDTQLVLQKLDDYLALSKSSKWAIVETGVATPSQNDFEYQIDYLQKITQFASGFSGDFLFLAWLNLFDYPSDFLEAQKFEKTGLFTLEGEPKPIVKFFGGGKYFDLRYQLLQNPTNVILVQSILIVFVILPIIRKRFPKNR